MGEYGQVGRIGTGGENRGRWGNMDWWGNKDMWGE